MIRNSGRTVEIDKLLILCALIFLVSLGWLTGAPVFEPFGRGRLTFLTVLGTPLVVLLLLLRRAGGEMRNLVRSWWPVLGILSVYESLKHMHANRITEWLGIQPKDALMLRIDEALFGKALPLWMDSWTAPWFQDLMSFFYIWVYYLGPFALLGAVYLARRDELFRRLRLGLVLGLLGGYVLYLLVPVAGPLFLVGDQFRHAIPSQSRLETLVFDTLRFNWDCFPSLHTAIPWILTVLSWRWLPRWVVACSAVLASGVTLSTVALRFHYGVDLIAAFVWVAIVCWAVERAAKHDYGRIRIRRGRARRRVAAALSPARATVRRLAWASGLVGGATAVTLAALERWAAIWIGVPLFASAAVLAGAAGGVGAVLALARRRPVASESPPRVAAIGSLGLAAWIALLGAPAGAVSAASWCATSISALGPGSAGVAGVLCVVAASLPLGTLAGFVLASLDGGIRAFRIPERAGLLWRWSAAGALAGLLAERIELAPRLGHGDTVLLAALLTAVAAWLCRRSQIEAAEPGAPLAVEPRGRGWRELLAAVVGVAVGATSLLWIFLFPAAMGARVGAFATVAAVALTAAWLVALRRPRRSTGRREGLSTTSWLLCLFGTLLALLSRLWSVAATEIAAAARGLPTDVAIERVRILAALLLMLPPSVALAAAARRILSDGDGTGRGRVLGSALAGVLLGVTVIAAGVPAGLGAPTAMAGTSALAAVAGLAGLALRFGLRPRVVLAALAVASCLGVGFVPWREQALATGAQLDLGRRRDARVPTSPLVQDAAAGFVAVLATPPQVSPPRREVVGNGLLFASAPDDAAEASALLGVARAGAGTRRALVVGASPATARALVRLGVGEVALVEPSRAVLAASLRIEDESFPADGPIRVVRGNARGLLATDGPYDLVVSRIEDFWLGVARGELDREFYEAVASGLSPRGAFVQALRLEALDVRALASIVAALSEALPRVSLRLDDGRVLLLATAQQQDSGLHPEALADRLELAEERRTGLGDWIRKPTLGSEQVAVWIALETPQVSSDRSGVLGLRSPDYRLRGDVTASTSAALRLLAVRIR